MNTDVMEGKWKQMRGQVKEWWGKLTEDDLDVIAGKRDQLVGKLQERYGWAKRDAEDEIARRFREVRVGGHGQAQDALTNRTQLSDGEVIQMRHLFRSMLVLTMLVAVTAGCTAMTGKSAGANVDDATITAEVKSKLAAEKVSTLTKVDVDTNKGTVYLTGNVENSTIKARATAIAKTVTGVREVVNNLAIQ